MDIFAPRSPVAWLIEAQDHASICPRALKTIWDVDPNKWWHTTQRGDWMLYAMFLLIQSRNRADKIMESISEYVKCPRVMEGISIIGGAGPRGRWAWNSTNPYSTREVTANDLALLANRVRKLYPDAPLVV